MFTGEVFSREKHREDAYDLVNISQDPSNEHANRLRSFPSGIASSKTQ
jgi:hypothetical protein